jgi:hypothetical protein
LVQPADARPHRAQSPRGEWHEVLYRVGREASSPPTPLPRGERGEGCAWRSRGGERGEGCARRSCCEGCQDGASVLGKHLDPTPFHNRNYRRRPASSLIARRPPFLLLRRGGAIGESFVPIGIHTDDVSARGERGEGCAWRSRGGERGEGRTQRAPASRRPQEKFKRRPDVPTALRWHCIHIALTLDLRILSLLPRKNCSVGSRARIRPNSLRDLKDWRLRRNPGSLNIAINPPGNHKFGGGGTEALVIPHLACEASRRATGDAARGSPRPARGRFPGPHV